MKRAGVFGGSFNPVHRGHLQLAEWLVEGGYFDEVLFNLSPLNPLKKGATDLASDADRAEMLSLALNGRKGLKPCLVELDMPRPSYTIDTLRLLQARDPHCRYSLIIGSDNWLLFDRWKECEEIIREFGVTVYPRPGYEVSLPLPAGVRYLPDAPVADISSSRLRGHKDEREQWLTPEVNNYIKAHKLYD